MSDEDSDLNNNNDDDMFATHDLDRNYDDNKDNNDSIDDDDDRVYDDNAQIITVWYDRESKKIFELDDNDDATFEDIRRKLADESQFCMSEDYIFTCINFEYNEDEENELYELVNNEDNDDDNYGNNRYIKLSNEDKCINYIRKTIVVKWMYFKVTVIEGLEAKLDVKVVASMVISQVKEQIQKDYGRVIDKLSFQGEELQDNETLSGRGIKQNGFQLVSKISVQIADLECELTTDLLICDFWDIETVINTYLDTERREMHKNSKIFYEDQELNKREIVYNLGMKNPSKLEYQVGEYPILIFDSHMNSKSVQQINNNNNNSNNNMDANAVKVNVYDYWTLDTVKMAYARITKKPFLEKEQLLSQERQLEKDVKLWKLRIRDHEKLFIEREQYDVVTQYMCCNCGLPVLLRKNDKVQCRECFHQILFKKRTHRVCQYNCR